MIGLVDRSLQFENRASQSEHQPVRCEDQGDPRKVHQGVQAHEHFPSCHDIDACRRLVQEDDSREPDDGDAHTEFALVASAERQTTVRMKEKTAILYNIVSLF